MITLGIVSPCYNEEEVLTRSVERLTELFDRLIHNEQIASNSFVLFVNDGSSDNTWKLIERFHTENHYVKGLNLARNVGHQHAIMAGMMTARQWADAVITIDADLQDDLEAIPQMLKAHEQGNDIVYGVKVQRKADPLMKRLSAQAFYRLQTKMGAESVYNHADFRLMSKRALDMLAGYGERNLYLRGLIPTIGLRATTVDDVIAEREAGVSKYTLSKMLGLALDGITSFSVRPLYGIVYMSIVFLLVSLCIAIYVLHALCTDNAMPGWASLMLSLWVIGGFVLMGIGIVGVYIGKIYTEVKHRPLYNIAEILE